MQPWQEQLILILLYRKGLSLHTMYSAHQVRDFTLCPEG